MNNQQFEERIEVYKKALFPFVTVRLTDFGLSIRFIEQSLFMSEIGDELIYSNHADDFYTRLKSTLKRIVNDKVKENQTKVNELINEFKEKNTLETPYVIIEPWRSKKIRNKESGVIKMKQEKEEKLDLKKGLEKVNEFINYAKQDLIDKIIFKIDYKRLTLGYTQYNSLQEKIEQEQKRKPKYNYSIPQKLVLLDSLGILDFIQESQNFKTQEILKELIALILNTNKDNISSQISALSFKNKGKGKNPYNDKNIDFLEKVRDNIPFEDKKRLIE
jgi:hypothetical protein